MDCGQYITNKPLTSKPLNKHIYVTIATSAVSTIKI